MKHNKIANHKVNNYFRMINHLNPVKREYAIQCKFPDKDRAEDTAYAEQLSKYLKSEIYIEDVMYHYLHSYDDSIQKFTSSNANKWTYSDDSKGSQI